jgi:hypothetical protein
MLDVKSEGTQCLLQESVTMAGLSLSYTFPQIFDRLLILHTLRRSVTWWARDLG